MKKILLILLALVAVMALAACGETPEEKDQKQFKEYLAANDALTVEEFDSLVTESEAASIPTDLFTNIKVENIHVAISNETDSTTNIDAYIWQTENNIYLATEEAMYLNLTELELAYDEARTVMENNTSKPSEMIDAYLKDMVSQGELQVNLDLETILGVASFKIDDFEQVEKGKYVLKNSALFEKIATISGGAISSADLEAQLSQVGYTINLYTYFDGSHINGYEVSIEMTQVGVSMTMSFKLMLSFAGDILTGYSVKANIPAAGELEFTVGVKDEVLSLDAKITSYEYNTEGMPQAVVISLNASISNENITLVIKQGEVEYLNCNLNFKYTKLNEVHAFGISGSLKVVASENQDGSKGIVNIVITSGSNVNIPDAVKAMEATATNALESMGQSEVLLDVPDEIE